MITNRKARAELVTAIQALHPGDPYFVEERVARVRGRFLRAVKDVEPGQGWWEVCYFYTYEGTCWAYLPATRQGPGLGWGYTVYQAYLNAIVQKTSGAGA